MNEQVKAKWLSALRSGEYTQAKGKLRVEDYFCCLGVLCDLHAKETGKSWHKNGAWSYLNETLHFPEEVAKWADVKSVVPRVEAAFLSDLNDRGSSFAQIADLIEKHL